MKFGIRLKLITAISALVIILFSLVASLFIHEKRVEIAEDIYLHNLAFTKLTAEDIAHNYDLFLDQNSFVFFNKAIKELFAENKDLGYIQVVNYSGEKLYDSNSDTDRRYEGEPRKVPENILTQIQSENTALTTASGRQIFLKDDQTVDQFEKSIAPREPGEQIQYFIVPATEKYSVIYGLDYSTLEARIDAMIKRIVLLSILGVLIGMLLAFFMAARITNPIQKLVHGAGKIAKGDFKSRVEIKTKDELNYLGESFNHMASELENSIQARIYQEKTQNELQIAGEIQKQIIPKTIPKVPGIDIAAQVISAEEIGGDMYDFIPHDDKGIFMYLGDVTGHGVPAGIVSSIANAVFYGYTGQADLRTPLKLVNRVLKAKTVSTMFMTLCLLYWDAVNKTVKYASAGHEQIIHFKSKQNDVELKPAGGIALGMLDKIDHLVQEIPVEVDMGDVLVIYSDGIPEAWRNEKETYGMDRLMQAVKAAGAKATAEDIKKHILDDVNNFRAGYKQQDDITIIVIKIN